MQCTIPWALLKTKRVLLIDASTLTNELPGPNGWPKPLPVLGWLQEILGLHTRKQHLQESVSQARDHARPGACSQHRMPHATSVTQSGQTGTPRCIAIRQRRTAYHHWAVFRW
jgi:hypothetical protein